jgi:MoaA/NifB/PqqE/SkfB family radical SAM enzyme
VSEYVRHISQTDKYFTPRLKQLDFELTERCNNDCIHCCINLPEGDADAGRRELAADQVKGILRQAAVLGCLQVCLTGGEPLLRSDFEEIYLFARQLGMEVLLFTNARLITPRLADLFRRIPPLVPIEVTVYGMHRESYEAVTRAKGSFAQFRRGVDLLLERGVPFIVKSALLPQNRHEVDELDAWAGSLPGMNGRPLYSLWFDLRHRRDDAGKNRLIASLRPSAEEGLAVYLRAGASHRRWTPEIAAAVLRPRGDRLFGCGACDGGGVCVDAYGRAQPCMGIRAPVFTCDVAGPDGRRSSLREALDRFTHLGDLRAKNPDYLRRCARCFLKGLCEQCPAKSWMESGAFDTPVEYLCDAAHAVARHLGWLGEGERSWDVREWLERIG